MGFLGMIALGIMSSCSKDDEPSYYEGEYGEGGYGDPSTPVARLPRHDDGEVHSLLRTRRKTELIGWTCILMG